MPIRENPCNECMPKASHLFNRNHKPFHRDGVARLAIFFSIFTQLPVIEKKNKTQSIKCSLDRCHLINRMKTCYRLKLWERPYKGRYQALPQCHLISHVLSFLPLFLAPPPHARQIPRLALSRKCVQYFEQFLVVASAATVAVTETCRFATEFPARARLEASRVSLQNSQKICQKNE